MALTIPSVREVLATRARASFPYRVDFNKPNVVEFAKMQSWCDKNCKGIWRSNSNYAYYFQFEDEYDATMFMLKWGSR